MITIRQSAYIEAAPETVFDIAVDLRGYGRWLVRSSAFHGTVDISDGPIGLGSTYREPGSGGVRHGTVTVFDPVRAVTFHQPMTMRPRLIGTIDVTVELEIRPRDTGASVARTVTLRIPWQLKIVQPLVVGQFRTESHRTLMALKAFAATGRHP